MQRKCPILITGIAGLIGSRLADWIAKNHPEYSIVGIDNLSGGFKENVNRNVFFYQIDAESDDLTNIFHSHKPELVYHLSAYAAEGLSPFVRKFNYQNNVIATANVVNNCIQHKIKRLVFTSSMAVYGFGAETNYRFENDGTTNFVPFFEDGVQPNPIDPYGIAKYACEMDIKVAGDQHSLDWCVIRPHNVYGRNQNLWDSYRNVIGIWMYKIMHNEPISIFGDGEQRRAFSYVDDILPCLLTAATSEKCSKQTINLGSPETEGYSINQMAQILKEVVGKPDYPTVHLPPRHEVKIAIPSARKSYEYLGFKHTTTLRDGVAKMWEWAQQQPERPRFIWRSYEIENGIYPFWTREALKNVEKIEEVKT